MNLETLSKNLSERIIDLRTKRSLTQVQLAKLAQVPRSTIANLESGTANPSLVLLAKISSALNTSIEILLSSPKSTCRKIPFEQLKNIIRANGDISILKLLPDPIPGMEIDKIELNPGAKMRGVPHASMTKEYLHCIQGEFNIYIGNEKIPLAKGDVLAFPGDIQHSYENCGKGRAIGLSVVVIAPLGF